MAPKQREEAALDIDFDDELAAIQGTVMGVAPPPPEAEVEVEGTVIISDRTLEFMGRRFRIADKIGLMPMLKFSAHSDMTTSDPGALSAMYSMLKDCIHPGHPGCGECEACDPERCGECGNCARTAAGESDRPCLKYTPEPSRCAEYDPGDWKAFENHAIDTKAEADDLLDVITKAIELIAGRPTEAPSSSLPGRRAISRGSTARSSARRGKGSRR